MKYSVVYSSQTGNTKLLADTVRQVLSKQNCNYFGYPDTVALNCDRLYVGFWTDKGNCDNLSAEFLTTIFNKEIFIFGTAGLGGDSGYFNKIIARISEKIDKSNKIIGFFMCQGKMPLTVRKRYEKLQNLPTFIPNLQNMITNFDKALSHPDENDLFRLKQEIMNTI